MGKLISLDDAEVRLLKDRISKAREDANKLRDIRKKCSNAYFREPLGNEVDGRSKVTHSEVFNHVESIHPALMKRYLASDHKVSVKGPDDQIARALKLLVRETIQDQGGFRLINDALKDGTILNQGSAKIWWSRIWGKSEAGEKILTEKELKVLTASPEWEVEVLEVIPGTEGLVDYGETFAHIKGATTYRANCTYTELVESNPVIANLPPEELITERGKVRVNDRWGVGHIRDNLYGGELVRENERLSSPGGAEYYKNLALAIRAADTMRSPSLEKDERDVRQAPLWDTTTDSVDVGGYSQDDLRKVCTIIEWADYVVSGGKLVPAIITFVNGEVVRAEENEEGIVPYCTWSPMVNPHSIHGLGVAWLHADSQNVMTVLLRAVLDSVAFSIDKPRMIRSKSADLLGLGNLTPGKLVVGQEGDYKDIDVGQIDYRIFQMVEFLTGNVEKRGPGTRYNMGADADTLNPTATGISLIQRASMNKTDMIALAFSELFLVDLYNKLVFLFQQNLDRPKKILVDGEFIELTRENIQGDYRAEGDLGLDVDFDDRAFAKAQTLVGMAMNIAKAYPMLYTADAIREHVKAVYLAAGEKDVGRLLPVLPEELKTWWPGRDQYLASQQQQQMAQAQAAAAPPVAAGGAPVPGRTLPLGPQDVASGIPGPEVGGRDFVSGQDTAQPDETMMES